MNKRTTATITTAAIGMAAATAAYMMTGKGHSSNKHVKKLKKNTGKALRQVGDFIDNVSYMMR